MDANSLHTDIWLKLMYNCVLLSSFVWVVQSRDCDWQGLGCRYTLGGLYLAHYDSSPAGIFDEVWDYLSIKSNLLCILDNSWQLSSTFVLLAMSWTGITAVSNIQNRECVVNCFKCFTSHFDKMCMLHTLFDCPCMHRWWCLQVLSGTHLLHARKCSF
jgi:hypothetical protein